jgi:hypothetical protein
MANKTPAEAREKWARNLKSAVPDIQAGVNRVSTAPGKAAAAKADKMLANLTESVRNGTWASRVGGVTLEEWKNATLTKGIGRIAAGVDGAGAKVEDFFGQLFSYQDSIQSKLKSMPDLTLEDSINRMTTWVRDMAKFSKK